MNPRQRLLSFACAKLAVTASCLRSLRTRPPVCSMRHREPHEGEVSEVLPWLHSAAGSHRGARHIRDQCSALPRAPLPPTPAGSSRASRHRRKSGSKRCNVRGMWRLRGSRPASTQLRNLFRASHRRHVRDVCPIRSRIRSCCLLCPPQTRSLLPDHAIILRAPLSMTPRVRALRGGVGGRRAGGSRGEVPRVTRARRTRSTPS